MKPLHLLPPILLLLSNSCTVHYGSIPVGQAVAETKTPAKTYFQASLGTDYNSYKQTAEGVEHTGQNQSKTALSVVRTIGTAVTTGILADTTMNSSNNATKEVLGAQNVTKSANAGKEATKQLKITTDGANQAAKIAQP